jgi:predicted RNA-binding protein
MNFLDAAEQVLKKSNKPLHYKEITNEILAEKLVETSGKTPKATLNALLGTDIKVNAEKSSFMRTARGFFGLREWEFEEYVPKTKKEKEEEGRVYWLISTSEKNFKHDRKVLGLKFQGLKERNKRTVMKFHPGDKVLYYIAGISKFGAIATITGGYYFDETKLWTENDEMWPCRAKSQPEIVLEDDELIDVRKLVPKLSFIKDTTNWGVFFQGSIRLIPEEDFRLVESEMKKVIARRGEKKLEISVDSELKTEQDYKKAIMKLSLQTKSLHDRIGEMLATVGSWMGYNTNTRQRITTESAYELDVSWLSGKNPAVAIEVQIGGNIDSAVKKLTEAKNFNYRKVILVIEESQLVRLNAILKYDSIRNWLDAWSIKSVYDLYISGEQFFNLYQRIDESRYKDLKTLNLV